EGPGDAANPGAIERTVPGNRPGPSGSPEVERVCAHPRLVDRSRADEEAFKGKTINIKIPHLTHCGECNGRGAKNASDIMRCGTCNGMGKVRMSQGFFTLEQTCPHCKGNGESIKNPCSTCNGKGVRKEQQSLSVQVPAGVGNGNRIRLAGKGDSGPKGVLPGDLYIFISIMPHEIFEIINEHDLLCTLPISIVQASLGSEVDVPTIEGKFARIKIAPGSQPFQRLRLRQKGMSKMDHSDRGDLFVDIQVEVPVNLTARQRELLLEFQKEGLDQSQHPATSKFFSKVRDLWDNLAN
ncbi:MAG: DnaJ C-terminal domain-containing protein, partial [Pseudomonadota bacterium]